MSRLVFALVAATVWPDSEVGLLASRVRESAADGRWRPRRFDGGDGRRRALVLALEFARAGAEYGEDPALLIAIARNETAFRTRRGRRGELGLMQVAPSTAHELCPDAARLQHDVGYGVRCGAAALARWRRACAARFERTPSDAEVFTAYVTGRCIQPGNYARRVLDQLEAACNGPR